MLSKKVKLPKKYWIKGKSKFLFYRLEEMKRQKLNELKTKAPEIAPVEIIIKRENLWTRIIKAIKKIFR